MSLERDYFDAIPRPDFIPDDKIYDPSKQQVPVVKQPFNQAPISPRNEENHPPPRYIKPDAKRELIMITFKCLFINF